MADVSNAERKVKITKSGKVVKKRERNPEEWHKQKQKRLRIAGLEYINANGKVVPAKKIGPDCHCRRKCYQKVPEEVRSKTFTGFYNLKSHDEQNAYLFGLMRQVDVKRKRVKSFSRRTCTFEYFIRVKGKETQVCQTAFKNIHGITERKVRVLCKKMDDGVMFPNDNRGKNSHSRAGEIRLPAGIVEQIKNHIYSIVHTHLLKDYIRLDKIAGLEINISKMWKNYIKTYDPEHYYATMPKSKRDSMEPNKPQNVPQPNPTPEAFTPIAYPATGQLNNLVSIAENYFHNQYTSANVASSATPGNFFQTPNSGQQEISLLLQQTGTLQTPHSTFIVLQPKPEMPIQKSDFAPKEYVTIQTVQQKVQTRKNKPEKRKGPLVKQWRYSNIFHDEVNGAALTAIKTRLAMYYAESDSKKKIKLMPQDSRQNQPPQQTVRQVHNVTIYQ